MKAIFLFLLFAISISAAASPEPFIKFLSGSPHVKAVDIYMVNFKDVPDVYSGKPGLGKGRASLNGEEIVMGCQSK